MLGTVLGIRVYVLTAGDRMLTFWWLKQYRHSLSHEIRKKSRAGGSRGCPLTHSAMSPRTHAFASLLLCSSWCVGDVSPQVARWLPGSLAAS